MKKGKTGAMIAMAGLLLASMSGCADLKTEDILHNDLGFVYSQVPAQTYLVGENTNYSSSFALIEGTDSMVAVLGGSSSCPPLIESITKTDTAVQINLKSYGNVMCTADFTYVAWQVTAITTNYTFKGKTITTCMDEKCTALMTKES